MQQEGPITVLGLDEGLLCRSWILRLRLVFRGEAGLPKPKKTINCTSVWLNCTCTVIDTDIDQANGTINQYIALKGTVSRDGFGF
jgi:hypothetical protein